MSKSITNGNWSRIGDNSLGFGLRRFSYGSGADERSLWRVEITGNPNNRFVEIDARISDLREIARWCETAIATIQSDGGRAGTDEAA